MNKQRFYLLIISALLITNVILFVYLFQTKAFSTHGPDRPRNIIIEKLKFNQEQVVAYDLLITAHRKTIKELNQTILDNKIILYQMLEKNEDKMKLDSLILNIADNQKAVELTHYHHFKEIKNICTADQLLLYNQFSREITEIFPQQGRMK